MDAEFPDCRCERGGRCELMSVNRVFVAVEFGSSPGLSGLEPRTSGISVSYCVS